MHAKIGKGNWLERYTFHWFMRVKCHTYLGDSLPWIYSYWLKVHKTVYGWTILGSCIGEHEGALFSCGGFCSSTLFKNIYTDERLRKLFWAVSDNDIVQLFKNLFRNTNGARGTNTGKIMSTNIFAYERPKFELNLNFTSYDSKCLQRPFWLVTLHIGAAQCHHCWFLKVSYWLNL